MQKFLQRREQTEGLAKESQKLFNVGASITGLAGEMGKANQTLAGEGQT